MNFCRRLVSSQGAELVSIRDKAAGRELMWQADAGVWGRHAPILFPYCGRLRGGAFTHRGVRYEGGQHGFARDMEHALVEKGEAHVSLCLEANVLTMEKFPFAFRLVNTYSLEGCSVVHHVQVENQSGEDMPFSFGYHPGFACPFDAGARHTGLCAAFQFAPDPHGGGGGRGQRPCDRRHPYVV